MKTRFFTLTQIFFSMVLFISACGPSISAPVITAIPELPETLAAKTWSAMQTSAAQSATVTPLPPTETPLPSATPTITNTPTATPTQIPQLTALPTNTPQPTFTATRVPRLTAIYTPRPTWGGGGSGNPSKTCLAARLVRDITIPNGQVLLPDEEFIKVWRIENTGSCTWDKRVKFVPSSTNPFTDSSKSLPENVRPGKTVDIAVRLDAPGSEGTYTGKWYLSAEGKRFGDRSADNPFKTVIEVQSSLPSVMFDFSQHMCQADWQSNARVSRSKLVLGSETDLGCPGKSGNPVGFVRQVDHPEMETGSTAGTGIWSNPPKKEDGEIKGIFPALLIHSGDHFTSQIGCRQDNEDCDVRFEFAIKIIAPPSNVIGQESENWHQVYDGAIDTIDLDLSHLAGEYVQISMRVRANNSTADNAAIWIKPRLTR